MGMNISRRYAIAIGLGLVVLALGACMREEPDAVPPVMAQLEQRGGRMAWTGTQPCADCDGIDTRLLLVRDRGARQFMLEEIYLAPGPVPFVSKGNWRLERGLLRLTADDGGETVYAVLADNGVLQPRDGHGRRLASNDGDGLLMPTQVVQDP